MSIREKVNQLTTIRSDIRSALVNKGVSASTHNFDKFAEDITSISAGSIEPEKSVTITSQTQSISPASGYDGMAKVNATVTPATITSGAGSATVSDPAYNSTNDNFTQSVTGTVTAPTVGEEGYVSSTAGTKNTNTVSGSKTLAKIAGSTSITGITTKQPSIARQSFTISGVTDAASGAATTTAPTSGVYVKVNSAANTGTLTATPSVSTAGYGTSSYHGVSGNTATVGASASADTYVPITTTSASVSGPTVSYGSGWISSGSKTVANGTAGTPTATKGSVTSNSITVTPSVTNTTGYITGGTKTGTAVTVSASELVSGTKSITENGTVDVTNYASVNVNVGSGEITFETQTISKTTATNSISFNIDKEPKAFYIFMNSTLASSTDDTIISIVYDGTSFYEETYKNGYIYYYTTGLSKTYSDGVLTITSSSHYFGGSGLSYKIDYAVGEGTISVETKTTTLTTGSNVISFTGLSYNPTNFATQIITSFTSAANRIIGVTANSTSIDGHLYNSTDGVSYSSSTFTKSYNNGILTITGPTDYEFRSSTTVQLYSFKLNGGSSITVEPKTITENGVYTAPSGTAYSPVTVNVSGGESSITKATATATLSSAAQSITFTGLSGEPKVFILLSQHTGTLGDNTVIASIIYDGANYVGKTIISSTRTAPDMASTITKSYSSGTFTLTSSSEYFNDEYKLVYLYGTGAVTYETDTQKVATSKYAATFKNFTKQPKLIVTSGIGSYSGSGSSSNNTKALTVISDFTNSEGTAIANANSEGLYYSDIYYSATYSNGNITVSSISSEQGGWFANEPNYTCYGFSWSTGGSIEVNPFTVSSSGTFTAPEGTAYSPVTVAAASASINTPTINTSTGVVTASGTLSTPGWLSSVPSSKTLSLTTKGATTYTPGTSNQTIAASTYLTGVQTISGDADLVAGNIKKGVQIFGVTGTYEGGGSGTSIGSKTATGSGAKTISFTSLSGQPTSFVVAAKSTQSSSSNAVTVVVYDGTNTFGSYANSGSKYSSTYFSSSYSRTTLTITSTTPVFASSTTYELYYSYGGSASTATYTPGSSATSLSFSGFTEAPSYWSAVLQADASTASGYSRCVFVYGTGTTVLGGHYYGSSSTFSSTAWTATISSGNFVITSSSTTTGGYMHVAVHQLTYVGEGGSGSSKNFQISQNGGRRASTSMGAISDTTLTVSKTGTYDIYCTIIRASSTSGTYSAQFYIGSTAHGTAISPSAIGVYTLSSTAVSLTSGQIITVYGKTPSTSAYIYAGNITIIEK